MAGIFLVVRPKTHRKKLKLKHFFLKTQAVFSKKNSRNRKFSKTLTANLLKLTTIWTPNVTFSNFLLHKMKIFVNNLINGKISITQAKFLKTEAKFCQKSSKILKNSIYQKFQLRPLPKKACLRFYPSAFWGWEFGMGATINCSLTENWGNRNIVVVFTTVKVARLVGLAPHWCDF